MKKTEWNLSDIYATEEDLKKDWEMVEINIEKLKDFEGKLDTEKSILEYLMLRDEIGKRIDKIYLIRYLKRDEDILDAKANKNFDEMEVLYQKYQDAQTFFESELLNMPKQFLEDIFLQEPRLEIYRLEIEDIIALKEHYLSKEEEYVLSSLNRTFDSFSTIYDTLNDGDIKFESVYDSNGKKYDNPTKVQLSAYREASDRTLRKSAFESTYNGYKRNAHTISKIYLSDVKKNIIISRIRKYPSFFEWEMERTNSTAKVYNYLIKTTNDHLGLTHKYYELKKKLLGIEKVYIYDLNQPIVSKIEKTKYTYEQAKIMVLKAIEPLGEEYKATLKRAFDSNWAHVYPKENKASGEYEYTMYGVHPYVLLNFTGTLYSVSTVAHEFGHAMHSHYINASQPYTTSYSLEMISEVASTTNEILLSESLSKNEKDLLKKIRYIESDIEKFEGAFIFCVMYAEFEKWVYDEIEEERQLTCEDICEYYGALIKKYYGEAIEETEGIQYGWAGIPHFYTPFYVYKYATGLASAICIAENLSKKGNNYANRYIEMLKMGASVRPLDQLRSVGVNLETEEPIKKAFEYYERKINEIERLIEEFNKE